MSDEINTADEIRESARILGRRGGYARAKALSKKRRREIAFEGARIANGSRTQKERSEIARIAARARWEGLRASRRISENARRIEMIKFLRSNAVVLEA